MDIVTLAAAKKSAASGEVTVSYDNLSDAPLELVDGKWISQRDGKLPVE